MNSQALNYLYVFLGTTCIMGLLVMDEEVLVLLCWVLFVGLSYVYGSSAINAIFEERREKFYKDMVVSYDFQEEALKVLINYHIVQVLIISEVKKLFVFSKTEIARILAKRQASFKFIIASQIEQKLSILADKETAVAAQVQDTINLTISTNILKLFKSDDKQVGILKERILLESMDKFENIATS
tara:strand:- start:8103 stop:8657 length:555 start_codon:yes stop_codon:yes gene_type:complete